MLDIHTHILPGMDDGSENVKQSIAMLRREAKQGIGRVAVTPHFYPNRESPEHFLKRRNAAVQSLVEKTSERKGLPEIIVGAEAAYFSGISRMEDVEALCLGNTRALLVEMPFCRWNSGMIDELVFLKECSGVQPILAHIERYLRYQPMGTVEQMCESGVWIQANASFFLRWQTSWLAMRMLKNRRIQFIGSDCHDIKNRPPNFGEAISRIEKRLGKSAVRYLNHMERRLLEGE